MPVKLKWLFFITQEHHTIEEGTLKGHNALQLIPFTGGIAQTYTGKVRL